MARTRRVERHVRRELKDIGDEIRIHELVSIVNRAGSDRVIRETVVTLQRRDVFRSSPDAVDFLSDMAHTAAESRRSKTLAPAPNCGPHFKQWLASDEGRRGRIVRALSPATCDVITRMVSSATR
jgi:hypothetical protein